MYSASRAVRLEEPLHRSKALVDELRVYERQFRHCLHLESILVLEYRHLWHCDPEFGGNDARNGVTGLHTNDELFDNASNMNTGYSTRTMGYFANAQSWCSYRAFVL